MNPKLQQAMDDLFTVKDNLQRLSSELEFINLGDYAHRLNMLKGTVFGVICDLDEGIRLEVQQRYNQDLRVAQEETQKLMERLMKGRQGEQK